MKKTDVFETLSPGENEAASLQFRIGAIFFLAGIFFSNMLARIILTPMMPLIEKDLTLGHDQAGGLVFTVTLGYSLMLLGSGFVSARLTHRRTVGLSGIAVGGAAELGSFSTGFVILGGCFLAVSLLVGRMELPDRQ